ncbi:MAG: serine hydrolase domain-containing protein [Lentisphaeria bacterium]|nr:serine hydrolase domain-containing protein [Lentisphaeria bacterium]
MAAIGVALVLIVGGCGTMSRNVVWPHDEAAGRLSRGGGLAEEVAALARPQVDSGYVMGMAVGVLLPDGSRHHFGFGRMAADDPLPPDGHTVFPVGSLGKLFMAGLVARLVAEGVWKWDATLGELLPPDIALSEDAARITLRQLATHSSGLPREPLSLPMTWYFFRYLLTGKSFYAHIDDAYLYRYLARFSVPAEVGDGDYIGYSNLGYGLLGRLVELRTGEDLAMALHERVTMPLGLEDTGFGVSPGRRRAWGHAGDQPKFVRRHRAVPEWDFTAMMRGAGGLCSTPDDLLRFAAAHLDPEASPLSPMLADNLAVQTYRPVRAQAVGWLVDTVDGEEIVFQMGMVAGYSGYLGMHRRSRLAVVVLQNNFNWRDEVGHNLLLRLIHGLAADRLP